MRRFKIDKLIRDRLPEIMADLGVNMTCRTMETEEHRRRLKDKLLEEAEEVFNAADSKELIDELADVLEVVINIAKVEGVELQDIIEAGDRKRLEKGGFEKKIYCETAELEDGHWNIAYYEAQPEKYPEEL